jgi:hypothetical protein
MNKDLKVLFRRCETLGCTVRRRRNNHYTITLPWGRKVFVGGTPSDHRAIRNMIRDLRKMGLAV